MTVRHASCSCGQLHLTVDGEPARVSMCHCLECQRRTGAVISNQARFKTEQVTVSGKATTWQRTAESGSVITFHFCPVCGSTVYWENDAFPGVIVVAVGAFADPTFPAPGIAVWEQTRHSWLELPADTPPTHMAKQG
ncbi:MAG: GFA family protein [Proteobacteria bacterium]|nr:GFA family protein [Pseudomonadota bacterium]